MTQLSLSFSILTQDQFKAFRTTFKKLAHEKQLTPKDILLNNLVRGLPLTRGFTPITNVIRLNNNGNQPTQAFNTTLVQLRSIFRHLHGVKFTHYHPYYRWTTHFPDIFNESHIISQCLEKLEQS